MCSVGDRGSSQERPAERKPEWDFVVSSVEYRISRTDYARESWRDKAKPAVDRELRPQNCIGLKLAFPACVISVEFAVHTEDA